MSPLALARHTTGPAALRNYKLRQEYAALVSLAMTQRRLSWKARREAKEYEAAADLANYRKAAAEARRLWRGAVWHLQRARDRRAVFNG